MLRELHRGGQGVVYLARQLSAGRLVAIKVIFTAGRRDDAVRARFRRELRTLAAIQHPGIVAVYDSGDMAGQPYLVMPFVDGPTLAERLALRPCSLRETLGLFRQVCDAIAAAHRLGIVHRDLKPSNIRVEADDRVLVLDFGLAKLCPQAADADPTEPDLTQTGQFLGSLPWASPEQVLGQSEDLDARSDVYSLGVLLFHMLVGRFPYASVTDTAQLRLDICERPPLRLGRLRRDADVDLETIVARCLAKEPSRRYADAGALRDDLDRYLSGRPIQARRESMAYTIYAHLRWCAARRPVAALLLVGAAAFLAGYVPLQTGWGVRYPDRAFAGWATGMLRAANPTAWTPDVAVLALDDAAYDAAAKLVPDGDFRELTPENPLPLRQLHGAALERLASARPRVTVLDIVFATPHEEFDRSLARGLDALRSAGGRVVAGVLDASAAGVPRLAPVVAQRADMWGFIKLWATRAPPWSREPELVRGAALAVSGGLRGPTLPALSAAAFALWRQPNARARLDFQDLSYLRIEYLGIHAGGDAGDHWFEPDELPVAERVPFGPAAPATAPGVEEWRILGLWTELPAPGVLAGATTRYSELFALADAEVIERFAGRIVVVGDQRFERTTKRDRRLLAGQQGPREDFSSYMHATAISDLLANFAVKRPGRFLEIVSHLLAVTAGVVVGWRAATRSSLWTAAGSALLLGSGLLALGLLTALAFQVVLYPTGLFISIALAAGSSAWVIVSARRLRLRSSSR